MELTVKKLQAMRDRIITVTYVIDDENGKPKQIEGKLLDASYDGIALMVRGNAVMLEMEEIGNIQSGPIVGKLVKRLLHEIRRSEARQHLLDRHAIPFDLLKAITADQAMELHEGIDHSNLGHNHRGPESGG